MTLAESENGTSVKSGILSALISHKKNIFHCYLNANYCSYSFD